MTPVLIGLLIILLFVYTCNSQEPFWLGQTRLAYPFLWRYPDKIRIGQRAPNNILNNPANVNIYKPYY
jgi:hypothetical protein